MRTGKINSFVICPLSFVFFLSSFIFYLVSCQRSTAPVYNPQKLQLTVADVSCTEAWLRLKTERTEKAENEKDLVLQVFRDDSLVVNKNWGAGDSLVYLDGLQPNTSYAFSAKLLQDNKLLAASPKVTATTMDTTSHDFTWQTFEFGGQGGSSTFYDVAIIDENDIWAVGEIYTADDKYNAAHWDGERWELKKIPSIICGNNSPIQSAIFTVYAFSPNNVWFSDGAELIHYTGANFKQDCSINPLLSGKINKIWGMSSSDLYIVGNDGLIAHYDGRQWQRIESGTSFDFHDIWSNINPYSGKREILAVASNFEYNKKGKQLIKINGESVSQIDTTGLPDALQTIWFKAGRIYYTGGDGLYQKKLNINLSERWHKIKGLPRLYKNAIRGTDINNIFVVGAYGLISHFNGITWHNYNPEEFPLIYGSYYALALTNSIVVATGFKNESGFILMGFKH